MCCRHLTLEEFKAGLEVCKDFGFKLKDDVSPDIVFEAMDEEKQGKISWKELIEVRTTCVFAA